MVGAINLFDLIPRDKLTIPLQNGIIRSSRRVGRFLTIIGLRRRRQECSSPEELERFGGGCRVARHADDVLKG